jgi:chromate transporter
MIDPVAYFLTFLKASLLSTGGLSNLPSLRRDLVAAGWAVDDDFGQAVVLGQLSPGPTGLWVVGLGYLTYGLVGAALALVAVTLPSFLVLAVAAGYGGIAGARWLAGGLRGVALAIIGVQLSIVWTILRQPGGDGRGLLIAAGALGLAASRRAPLPLILALAGLAGYALYR